jgi:hypothetical protein
VPNGWIARRSHAQISSTPSVKRLSLLLPTRSLTDILSVLPLRSLRNRFPSCAMTQNKGLSIFFASRKGSGQIIVYSAHRTIYMFPPSLLGISQGWGLIDLPLRVSNEGSLRPRVVRAQEIIRLQPLLCSVSDGDQQRTFTTVTPSPPSARSPVRKSAT